MKGIRIITAHQADMIGSHPFGQLRDHFRGGPSVERVTLKTQCSGLQAKQAQHAERDDRQRYQHLDH